MSADKPFYPATHRNREPILARLKTLFTEPSLVVEVGSGTGQHAVYFTEQMPHLRWLPSDLPEALPGIRRWIAEVAHQRILPPVALDVTAERWPIPDLEEPIDALFSANTLHIVSWQAVEKLFAGAARLLRPGGLLCIYGPFNYGGAYTSDGNRRFDATLRANDPQSGIRDVEALHELARSVRLQPQNDFEMPANNRLLVWRLEKCSEV